MLVGVIVLCLAVAGVRGCNNLVHKMGVGTVEEQLIIVQNFEEKVNELDKEADGLNKQVSKELLKIADYEMPDLELIEKAEKTNNSISIRMEDIEIPKGLTKEREERLTEIKADFAQMYKFKSNAMFYYSLAFEESDPEMLQSFNANTDVAYNIMLRATTDLELLKKELGFSQDEAKS